MHTQSVQIYVCANNTISRWVKNKIGFYFFLSHRPSKLVCRLTIIKIWPTRTSITISIIKRTDGHVAVTWFSDLCTCRGVLRKLTGAAISRVLSTRPVRCTEELEGCRRGLQRADFADACADNQITTTSPNGYFHANSTPHMKQPRPPPWRLFYPFAATANIISTPQLLPRHTFRVCPTSYHPHPPLMPVFIHHPPSTFLHPL